MKHLLIPVVLLLAACSSWRRHADVPPGLVGRWEGSGRIVVAWCEQERLAVDLTLADDGRVSGRVGDATLSEAFLSLNAGRWKDRLGVATHWIVVGDLEGPVVATEGIEREGVRIPFDLEDDGSLAAGLHTTGEHVGPPSTMVLTVADLRLERR